ncbi:hypothetical protein [Streptomyces lateritius]|uniref:hypothetical protein n=1 Tax=Streptomyces lateritius TaxID=67313 RepID=UPI001C8B4B9A|nr:hypothetical protein [Streptomyces lateritius]MBX9425472.1 hypothetical protein [Streptomyces lateritius]
MADLNHLGADQAHALRITTQVLAETDNLRNTSSLREVLLDLSYALANLAGPIGALTDAWVEQGGEAPDGDLPDVDALVILAADLRQMADNT